MVLAWTKDDDGRYELLDVGLKWEDVRGDFPNGVRKIDWPRFPGGHEVSYQHGIASSLDPVRGPWEHGTCRYCGREVMLYMMEPEACPVGPEWMRTSDDYTGPTTRETED